MFPRRECDTAHTEYFVTLIFVKGSDRAKFVQKNSNPPSIPSVGQDIAVVSRSDGTTVTIVGEAEKVALAVRENENASGGLNLGYLYDITVK